MMTLTKRQWTLGSLLAATLAAVAWVGSNDPAGEGTSQATPGRGTEHAARHASGSDSVVGGVEPQRLIRMMAQRRVGDPFAAVSFMPPPAPPKPAITVAAPPPPPPPAPPAAPTAPPFPWTFMGRMIEDPQNPAVFLSRGDRLTVAHMGDVLENTWKVVGMDARGLRAEYLPLKSVHTVSMPAGSDTVGTVSGATVAAQQAAQSVLLPQIQQQMNLQEAAPAQPAEGRPVATPPAAAAPAPVSGIEISNGFGNH